MNDSRLPHFLFPSLIFLIVINLFILDLKFFSASSHLTLSENVKNTVPSKDNARGETYSCPIDCLSAIKEATQNIALRTGIAGTNQYNEINLKITSGNPKEYYIPLGSGVTSKSDWDDITATETIINPDNYGAIKEAYFVASLRNPTQNGQTEARLYNVTDNYPLWGSHVVMNGPLSQTINSDKIALPSGNKLYRVQLKSTMSYPVYLDNAKIRIITE